MPNLKLKPTVVVLYCFCCFLGVFAITLSSCSRLKNDSCKISESIHPEVQNYKPGQVKLLDGPFKKSFAATENYLASLELNRLIAPYRRESGLEMKAEPYPGWEGSLPGVALSFYLSGASRIYAQTQNQNFLENIEYIIRELKLCQANNNGYLLGSKGGKTIFRRLEEEGHFEGFSDWPEGHGTPYYVMEKLFSGLLDVYRICKKEEALKMAINLADWLHKHMQELSEKDLQKIMKVEYGGMNWVLADLYGITGDKKYLEMSKRWHDKEVVVPMTNGDDVLSGIHANTQFPKMSGLAARYIYTGDSTDLFGAQFFWEKVVNYRTYATGGNSEGEDFSEPNKLANTLTQYTEENCNVYNMLKLTALLNSIDPDVKYADYTERSMWNHLLSAQNSNNGRVCYYLPLISGAEREYQTLYRSFTCCVCSGMDSYTRHADYIYAYNDSVIYLNQFIASELTSEAHGVKLTQQTEFPFQNKVNIKMVCDASRVFALRIRNPYWLALPMTVTVNGEFVDIKPKKGYIDISRKWVSGDVVELKLPMNIRQEEMPDDPDLVALFYGPVLLAADLSTEEGENLVEQNRAPALVSDNPFDSRSFEAVSDSLGFKSKYSQSKSFSIKPFFLARDNYSVYWRRMNTKEWKKNVELTQAKKLEQKFLEESTIDAVFIGDEKNEQEHRLTGESYLGKGNKGIYQAEAWRVATDTSGFSVRMKMGTDGSSRLYLKFMGPVHYEKWDCKIKVDTFLVDHLKRGKEPSYPHPKIFSYLLPKEITQQKDSVEVSFSVSEGWKMPRLNEIRILEK